jgi:hypothetical protein
MLDVYEPERPDSAALARSGMEDPVRGRPIWVWVLGNLLALAVACVFA